MTNNPNINGPEAFEEPGAEQIAAWLVAFARAVRGTRIYAENNETLIRYLDAAFDALHPILERDGSVVLAVREDRLMYGPDAVFVDANRQESIPFILYRSGFRRISFEQGLERDEIAELVRAIVADYARFDLVEEDLVSALWRLALPHFRYVVVDILAIDATEADNADEREEIERIQQDIESIVAAVFKSGEPSDDTVAGVSITKADIEAYAEASKEDKKTIEKLDRETARPITDVPRRVIDDLKSLSDDEARQQSVTELCRVWMEILLSRPAPEALAGSLRLIDDLLDTVVISGRFIDAAWLSNMVNPPPDAPHAHALMAVVTKRPRVLAALERLGTQSTPIDPRGLTAWLKSLGSVVSPTLLDGLQALSNPAHRRLVCEQIVSLGVPPINVVLSKMAVSEWFVTRDILSLAEAMTPEDVEHMVIEGLLHPHPKVRERAIAASRRMNSGRRDILVARHIEDDEAVVRISAVRLAASLEMKRAHAPIEKRMEVDVLQKLDLNEVRALTMAYVRLSGNEALPRLAKLLNPPLLKRLATPELQVAAALALGALGTAEARVVLERGLTRRSRRIREACQRALNPNVAAASTADIRQLVAMTDDVPRTSSPESPGLPEEYPDPDLPLELTPSALTELSPDGRMELTPGTLERLGLANVDVLPKIPTSIYENLAADDGRDDGDDS